MVISPLALRRLSWAMIALLMFIALFLAWTAVQNQESTLAIRSVNQGASVPDGFSVWHHLMRTAFVLRALRRRTTCC